MKNVVCAQNTRFGNPNNTTGYGALDFYRYVINDPSIYIDIYGDYESNKVILGMLADRPLQTFLEEHRNIKYIEFCLDNDEPARVAVLGIPEQNKSGYKEKYEAMGYAVTDSPAAPYGKDYNENLKYYNEYMPEKICMKYSKYKR